MMQSALRLLRISAASLVGSLLLIVVPHHATAQATPARVTVELLEQLLDEAGIGVVRNEVHRLLAGLEGVRTLELSELLEFGNDLQVAGRRTEAVAVLQLAAECFPESVQARMLLGNAWEAAGDFDRQASSYGDALAVIDRAELYSYLREHGEDLPRTAQDVIDRHLSAIGGREALQAVRTMEIRYTGHDDNGVSSTIVRQYRRPHYVRQSNEGGDHAIVTDGRTTWRVSGSEWVELEDGDFKHRPDLTHDLMSFESKGINYTYHGVVADDGVVFHQLRKIYPDAYAEDYYFSAASGLLTRIASRGVIGPSETHYWDYAPEGDILVPHIFIVVPQQYDGTHGGVVREVRLNPQLPDSLFRKP